MDQNQLMEIWNSQSVFPKIKALVGRRKAMADARWKENPNRSFWESLLTMIKESDFCVGKNASGWVANFDWFIRPDTCVKILEGKYNNRESNRLDFDRIIGIITVYDTRTALPENHKLSVAELKFFEANGGRHAVSQMHISVIKELVRGWKGQ